jgi:hypothetical protein
MAPQGSRIQNEPMSASNCRGSQNSGSGFRDGNNKAAKFANVLRTVVNLFEDAEEA